VPDNRRRRSTSLLCTRASTAMATDAARCLFVRASPETNKVPASILASSSSAASVPLRAAAGSSSGRRLSLALLQCSLSPSEGPSAPELAVLLEVEG
jgi:hypothetical protein